MLYALHRIRIRTHLRTFANVWSKNAQRNNEHNLRNVDKFTLLPVRIEQFRRIPSYSFALAWNECGDERFHEHKRTTFKIS